MKLQTLFRQRQGLKLLFWIFFAKYLAARVVMTL